MTADKKSKKTSAINVASRQNGLPRMQSKARATQQRSVYENTRGCEQHSNAALHRSSSILTDFKITHLWSRLTTIAWEDAWIERLRFVGLEYLVIKAFPASRTLRLQVYTNKKIGTQLRKNFGGTLRPFNMDAWTLPAPIDQKPLSIGKNLCVHNSEHSFLQAEKKSSAQQKQHLLIPAGMAFGTGDHATTSSCLRLLNEIQKALPKNNWSLLDLGTGSGILALAAELFGAQKILGIDFDEKCVAIAQENARINNRRCARFEHADLLRWKPPGTWDVIAANIYSTVLTAAAKKIVTALRKNGHLILSGILSVEKKNIVATFETHGLQLQKIRTRGKWCALLFKK